MSFSKAQLNSFKTNLDNDRLINLITKILKKNQSKVINILLNSNDEGR